MNRRNSTLLACAVSVCAAFPALPGAIDPLPDVVEFNRDVRPILSDACCKCHGPDAAKRKAKLRLDTEAGAFAPRDDVVPIVRGKPDESEVIDRITSTDPEEHMPPPEAARRLTPHEIAVLRRWIEQGAK